MSNYLETLKLGEYMSERSEQYRALATHWDMKVKSLAQKCLDYELLKLVSAEVTPENQIKVKELSKKFVDPTAMWYVSQFIWAMEHDLADDGFYLKAFNCLMQVKGTLSDSSYWADVWKGQQNKERQNLEILRDALPELFELLTQRMSVKNGNN
jgi:hypothetical protein